jgi:hypothetical protein
MKMDFHKERIERILKFITEDYAIIDGPKKSPKGLTAILEKASKKKVEKNPEKDKKDVKKDKVLDKKAEKLAKAKSFQEKNS